MEISESEFLLIRTNVHLPVINNRFRFCYKFVVHSRFIPIHDYTMK